MVNKTSVQYFANTQFSMIACRSPTQRSLFPSRSIDEPSGKTDPIAVQGPSMEEAEAYEILFPVEKRKYVPSDSRLIKAGSWMLHAPEHAPGEP